MIHFFVTLDRQLFLFLNNLYTAPWTDTFFLQVSQRFIWIPLYVIVAGLIIYRYKKKSVIIILSIILTIVFTDQSCNIIKKNVKRLRPSHDTELENKVHMVAQEDGSIYRGGMYGFPSSHGANAAAFAYWTIIMLCINNKNGRAFRTACIIFIIIWVLLISYSRIYLGVHYLGDIVAGWVIGILWGGIFSLLSRQLSKMICKIKRAKIKKKENINSN